LAQGLDYSQPGSYGPLGVIFVRQGVAEVDEQAITETLRDMPREAGDDLGADLLIGPHHRAQVFGVEIERYRAMAVTSAWWAGSRWPVAAYSVPRLRWQWAWSGRMPSSASRVRAWRFGGEALRLDEFVPKRL